MDVALPNGTTTRLTDSSMDRETPDMDTPPEKVPPSEDRALGDLLKIARIVAQRYGRARDVVQSADSSASFVMFSE